MSIDLSGEWITALITMIGTVFAGFGLKMVDAWLSRAATKKKVDSELREEYRDTITDKRRDIAELKKDLEDAKREIDMLESEVVAWKDKYFEELNAKMEIMARLRLLEERYKDE